MAFREWRKVNFFESNTSIDELILKASVPNPVVFATSGNDRIVLGDSNGFVYIITRQWTITSFKAYDDSLSFGYQFKDVSLLITIGVNKKGSYPILKVWDLNQLTRSNEPICLRSTRLATQNFVVAATALAVHDAKQYISIGFADGSLIFFYGNIRRDKTSKQKIRKDYKFKITGLSFSCNNDIHLLFISTTDNVYVYNFTNIDKDEKFLLDNVGANCRCIVRPESNFEYPCIVGKTDAIYCYTNDGRGPCYAIDGEKLLLMWFRNYLLIISKLEIKKADDPEKVYETHQITVFDIQHKLIVYSQTLRDVTIAVYQWDCLYFIGHGNVLSVISEINIESKLSLLFKKNLYDVAIRVAKLEQYYADRLVDIYKKYGDHLFSKGDYFGAVQQYTRTIGKFDSSYVIVKFLGIGNFEMLATYLLAVHNYGYSTPNHTILLIHCLHKIGHKNELNQFIRNQDTTFNTDVAIRVCYQLSYLEECLFLAKKNQQHDWVMKIKIEGEKNYKAGLDYVNELDVHNGLNYLKKYANELFKNERKQFTNILKSVISKCTDRSQINFDHFLGLFLNDSLYLVDFYEFLYDNDIVLSQTVSNVFYEHILRVWSQTKPNDCETLLRTEAAAVKLLKNKTSNLNRTHAMFVSKKFDFTIGIVALLEEDNRYEQVLDYYFEKNEPRQAFAACVRFGYQPYLWLKILRECSKNFETSQEILVDTLSQITKLNSYSPLTVLECLSNDKQFIKLKQIRSYLQMEVDKYREPDEKVAVNNKTAAAAAAAAAANDDDSKNVDSIKNQPIVFCNTTCLVCQQQLQLPSVHFLCNHSYHKYCLLSTSENLKECPTCTNESRTALDIISSRDFDTKLHDTFHKELQKTGDICMLIAKYFERGIFQQSNALQKQLSNANDPSIVRTKPIETTSATVAASVPGTSSNPFGNETVNDDDDDDKDNDDDDANDDDNDSVDNVKRNVFDEDDDNNNENNTNAQASNRKEIESKNFGNPFENSKSGPKRIKSTNPFDNE